MLSYYHCHLFYTCHMLNAVGAFYCLILAATFPSRVCEQPHFTVEDFKVRDVRLAAQVHTAG